MGLQGAAALSRMKAATVKFVLEDADMATGQESETGKVVEHLVKRLEDSNLMLEIEMPNMPSVCLLLQV
jgi:hypothetical protein